MPEFYGEWSTVYCRFRRWGKSGIFDRMLAVLAADLDDEYVMLDASIVRVYQHGAGAKGGSNSKRSVDQEEGYPARSTRLWTASAIPCVLK